VPLGRGPERPDQQGDHDSRASRSSPVRELGSSLDRRILGSICPLHSGHWLPHPAPEPLAGGRRPPTDHGEIDPRTSQENFAADHSRADSPQIGSAGPVGAFSRVPLPAQATPRRARARFARAQNGRRRRGRPGGLPPEHGSASTRAARRPWRRHRPPAHPRARTAMRDAGGRGDAGAMAAAAAELLADPVLWRQARRARRAAAARLRRANRARARRRRSPGPGSGSGRRPTGPADRSEENQHRLCSAADFLARPGVNLAVILWGPTSAPALRPPGAAATGRCARADTAPESVGRDDDRVLAPGDERLACCPWSPCWSGPFRASPRGTPCASAPCCRWPSW